MKKHSDYKSYYLFILLSISVVLNSCHNDNTIDPLTVTNNDRLQEFILRGWNTWNNADVLNFVYLPEGLSLKIGFRQSDISDPPHYVDRLTINTTSYNDEVQLNPASHSSDGRYIDCHMVWKDFEGRIQVIIKRGDIIILYTPVKIPEHPPVMILETGIIWDKRGKLERNGHLIQAEAGTKIISIGTTQKSNDILFPLSNLYFSFDSKTETGIYTGPVRTVEQIKDLIEKRLEIFNSKHQQFGNLSNAFDLVESTLSWNLIYDPDNHRAVTMVSREKAEKMGGWVLYNPDSYYSALMFGVDDKFHCYSNAIAITKGINEEGFIPGFVSSLVSANPAIQSRAPVGSLVCYLIYKKFKEKWFLQEVYKELLSWNRWWDKARNNKGFLSWGTGGTGPLTNKREGALSESILSGTPVFDDIAYDRKNRKMEVASVELLSLYIADCNALAEIAGILEKNDEQSELLQRAQKYSEKLKELWDDQLGIYRDKNLLSNQFHSRITSANFFPLLTGVPDRQKAERMVNEHLLNPDEFFGEFMIPLIPKNDPSFNDSTASKFRILPEMNFLIYLGLRNYGFPEVRKMLADKSMDLVMREWGLKREVFPGYHPVTGLGSDIPGNDSFYTTGALLAFISLMEGGFWEISRE